MFDERSLRGVCALALISLSACSGGGGSGSGDSDGGGPTFEGSSSAVIGPEGGSVELGEMSLDVPPGALSEAIEISVEASAATVEGIDRLSAVYVFSPDGLVFAVPARISFDLDHGAPGAKLFHGDDLGAPPDEVAGAMIRDASVEAMISGFSYYAVGTRVGSHVIPDVDESFEFQGARYSAGPVGQGLITGFSYDFAGAAAVHDGETGGRVWYGSSYCVTFRPDGTGVLDWAGGTTQRLSEFPWIGVEAIPGEAESAAAASPQAMQPAGDMIMDPEYDRASELRPFRWGVRLNEDQTIYEDYDGFYETRLEFEDGSPASTLAWDPATNSHGTLLPGSGQLTTELPADNHFCRFREVASTSLADQHMRCVQTVEEYSGGLSFMKSHCYARGMVQGPYSMTDINGVEIESGMFEDNHPVGDWTLRSLEGVLWASGSFNEHGLHQGKWQGYDYQGLLSTVATFKGNLNPTGRGTYYRALDGAFEAYVVSQTSGSAYLNRSGSLVDGKRSGPWRTYDEAGGLVSDENYDLATQIPNGETCYSLEEGGFECVPVSLSWRTNAFWYDWGGCVSGSNTLTFSTFNTDGSSISMECFELEGTPQEPTKGASKSCGSACGA